MCVYSRHHMDFFMLSYMVFIFEKWHIHWYTCQRVIYIGLVTLFSFLDFYFIFSFFDAFRIHYHSIESRMSFRYIFLAGILHVSATIHSHTYWGLKLDHICQFYTSEGNKKSCLRFWGEFSSWTFKESQLRDISKKNYRQHTHQSSHRIPRARKERRGEKER